MNPAQSRRERHERHERERRGLSVSRHGRVVGKCTPVDENPTIWIASFGTETVGRYWTIAMAEKAVIAAAKDYERRMGRE